MATCPILRAPPGESHGGTAGENVELRPLNAVHIALPPEPANLAPVASTSQHPLENPALRTRTPSTDVDMSRLHVVSFAESAAAPSRDVTSSYGSASVIVPAHPGLRPRNICLFFDGTGNAAFFHRITNIATMFSLASHCDQTQLVYYQTGIGTPLAHPRGMQSLPQRVGAQISATVDQAVAFSLGEHVQRGYAFLMNTWQPGDRIFLFGFSRGAFTARAVAGMLQKVGLLPKYNEESIPLAYALYKRARDVPMGLSARNAARSFKQKFCRTVDVHFVGVFDTVSTVGGLFPRTLPFASGSAYIRHFRHALALDERRTHYKYQPWIPPDGRRLPPDHSVKEVWFAGAHSDVGGGQFQYDYDQQPALGHLALRWMLREAVAAGFLLDTTRLTQSPIFAMRQGGRGPHFADQRQSADAEDAAKLSGYGTLNDYLEDLAKAYPDSSDEVAKIVYKAADQRQWRHDAALAPRGDALSLSIEARDPPAEGNGSPIRDWFARQNQRVKTLGWWIPQSFPIVKLAERDQNGKNKFKLRIKRRRSRRLPLSPSFHYSVKDRMNAQPEELAWAGRGNNQNVPEKGGYQSRARFARGETIENVQWVG
ncbi:hypothetical protein JCM10908_005812 [Rhodotorula pacifica]|uniref:T6SS phospholipase effector Tle1-like catalytic domain-containing protein n=1 Tax=Rhodotorula pacifica TaxID=1495444 RepID=UPI00316CAA81